ncbi:HBR408Wp [Eremothecium sinecaudum]|uniref:HBR408Wp n=1 Tax=Eremothecium sinecaudum TaxID=45286 RepID=A0A120K1E5_9SACH|nr:HBR408Wp [Eremothecium sinecaudum]AMD19309.1 HBR408Wp [Eremothecium sinecaudum]
MAGVRLVEVIKPFMWLLPEVELPYEKISFDDKVVYTLIAVLIYMFGQLPLAGLLKEATEVKDPLFFMRGVFAAEPRTLMEFGIFPPVATALLFQLLAGMKIIKVNFKHQQERQLFQSSIKFFSIIQYAILANIFIFSGYYGESLSASTALLLNLQLIGAGTLTTLLIEVIDKGYGFGSGVMAFSAATVATSFVSDTFGVTQIFIDSTNGIKEPQGALINLIQGLTSKHKTFIGAIFNAFQRDYLPNLTTVCMVAAVAAAVGYLQSCRLDLPIRSTRARGMNNVYPVRLLYTSGMSVLFSYVILFYIHIVAFTVIQLFGRNDPQNILVKILGRYNVVKDLYYVPSFPMSLLVPPKSLFDGLFRQPLTIITFAIFLVTTGVWFASRWQEISGSSAHDCSAQFKEQGITLIGVREQSVAKELGKVIPLAASTGAATMALLVAIGEYLGLKGAAASIVVGISSAFSLVELVGMEFQQSGGQSALAQAFGNPSGA